MLDWNSARRVGVADVAGRDDQQALRRAVQQWLSRKSRSLVTTTRSRASATPMMSRSVVRLPCGEVERVDRVVAEIVRGVGEPPRQLGVDHAVESGHALMRPGRTSRWPTGRYSNPDGTSSVDAAQTLGAPRPRALG